MLKANIIYLPGTGGSFLRRALTLSDRAIMNVHDCLPTANIKFDLYNNWNKHDWKSKEKLHRPTYRDGKSEFYFFEQSDGYLIDAWHPVEFLEHDTSSRAWSTGAWPCLIFIKVDQQYRIFLENNQHKKKI